MHWTEIKTIADESQNVTKFVFTNDTVVAEAVLYRYPTYEERTVICCSTQSGCPVGCRFCGAGDFFVRSLTDEEIVEQVSHCIKFSGVPPEGMKKLQIMFMSMGEPMLNWRHLESALKILYARYPDARLLISTSGPDVDYTPLCDLSAEIPNIGLQFSVHESTDAARDLLVPFKKKLTLRQISLIGIAWCHYYTGRKPFFNYCAHDNNSSQEDADRLREIFDPFFWEATISVICERSEGLPATNEHQRELARSFSEKLLNLGYNVRVFDPAGQDTIGGGCGQLWFVQSWAKERADHVRPSIGCGLPEVHVPTP